MRRFFRTGIRSVRFTGNEAFSDGTLTRRMKENRPGGLLGWLMGGGTYKEAAYEEDAARIEALTARLDALDPIAKLALQRVAVIGGASTAEQVQLKWGMLNICRTEPFGTPCSGVTNSSPWFDNIALGIAGSAHSPAVSIITFDTLQDNFAADGSLNPASTARIDQNRLKNDSAPDPGSTRVGSRASFR